MRSRSLRHLWPLGTSLAALGASVSAYAAEAENASEGAEAIIVTGLRTTYNNVALDETLIDDKAPASSVLDIVGTLPGVQVNQGGAFGFDDWSTTVAVRGYQTNLDQQQVAPPSTDCPTAARTMAAGPRPTAMSIPRTSGDPLRPARLCEISPQRPCRRSHHRH